MKKALSYLLLLTLLISAIPVFAVEKPVTHYELRTGVVFAWCNSAGKWQAGIEAGEVYNNPTTTVYDIGALFPYEIIENANVYPYTLAFDFAKLGDNWNKTQFAVDKDSYDENYYFQSLSDLRTSYSWNQKTGKLEYSYSGTLNTINGDPINVKDYLRRGEVDKIYAMMGYTTTTVPADIKAAMEELYPKAGQSENVQGFLYFVPFIIQYDVVPLEIGLLPPKCRINCSAGSAFIGTSSKIQGSVSNQNTFPVIMNYELTVNGNPVKAFRNKAVGAKGSFTVVESFAIPATAKPGTTYEILLTAKNVARAEDPPSKYNYHYGGEDHERVYSQAEWDALLNAYDRDTQHDMLDNVTRKVTAEWTRYMDTHVRDSDSGAWYLKNGQWKSGISNKCIRTAVPMPEAPLDHSLNPAVIVN